MLGYTVKRLLQLAVTILGIVTLVFFTLRLIPGDAASAMAGDTLSGEALERLREQMGLGEPLFTQYVRYLQNLVSLNLGQTVTTGLPIAGTADVGDTGHVQHRARDHRADGHAGHSARHAGGVHGLQGS